MIPFNRATVAPRQLAYVEESFNSAVISGDGNFTRLASDALSRLHGGAKVLLTTSCTAALELSALLLDLHPNDEVIVPSFTFVSSANAFALMGATIVFADINEQTLTIDEDCLASLVTDRTRAIVAVNYGGYPAVTATMRRFCQSRSITIVEDNAHGLFGSDGSLPLGTQSSLSTLSFHETKNISCGEGGALVINDPSHIDRAEIIREKGTNRSKFFRGAVDKYTWVDLGSSYLMSDIAAAILLSQVEHAETIQRRRATLAELYDASLAAWMEANGVQAPVCNTRAGSPHHLYCALFPDLTTRTRFMKHMKDHGVAVAFHYIPLDTSPGGRRFGRAPLGCEISQDISDRLVRLPLFSDMRDDEHRNVIEAALKFRS